MADRSFEMALERMYGETAPYPDNDLFVFRVGQRLEHGWTLRQVLIGALGIMGGLIGGAQVLGSGLLGRIGALSARSDAALTQGLSRLTEAHLLPAGFTINAEAVWMSAGLLAVAIGLGVTRAIRQI